MNYAERPSAVSSVRDVAVGPGRCERAHSAGPPAPQNVKPSAITKPIWCSERTL
jgi:hypothetical protein